VASTTGGTARAADGSDTFTVTITVKDGNGDPLIGAASQLSVTATGPVGLSVIVDNGNGTYTVAVTSATPGNYQITARLGGQQVGGPMPVNFIAATRQQPQRTLGQQQSAEGFGFLPGEKVHVTVHSAPLDLGVFTADANGDVPVSFTVPSDFELGTHTVEFAGVTSGTASATFQVVAAAPLADTGGSVLSSPGVMAPLALALVVAGLIVAVILRRGRNVPRRATV